MIPIEKFFSKVSTVHPNGCWKWGGAISADGYGTIRLKAYRSGKMMYAHRVSFFIFKGELAPSLVIDHICRNRYCVNPDHLRQVSRRINTLENSQSPAVFNALKTHCPDGHEYSLENTRIVTVKGKFYGRRCETCRKAQASDPAYMERRRIRRRKKPKR